VFTLFSSKSKSPRTTFSMTDRDPSWDFSAGDRMAPIRKRGAGKILRLGGLGLLLVMAGGWAAFGDRDVWPAWLQTELAGISASIERRVQSLAEPGPSVTPVPEPPAATAPSLTKPDAAKPEMLAPAATTLAASSNMTLAALPADVAPLPPKPAVSSNPAAEASVPYTPLKAAPVEPYQKRAEAAGLHTDLSRALLERLSPADYRNAGDAIRTALAETPDDGVLVWPRPRRPDLALFEVRFVAGAAPDCRRYVVSVLKDGWSTMAMPVEKCGIQRRQAQR
jgi:hypothetical protein